MGLNEYRGDRLVFTLSHILKLGGVDNKSLFCSRGVCLLALLLDASGLTLSACQARLAVCWSQHTGTTTLLWVYAPTCKTDFSLSHLMTLPHS